MNRRLALLLSGVLFAAVAGCGQGATSVAQRSPSPSPASSPVAPAPLSDWLEYHGTAARTGQGPASPAVSHPQQAWKQPVDAAVYASPLIYHGRVIVATENNTMYSFNLADGSLFWSVHLGAPVDAYSLPCGNIAPITGITGTPAIDPSNGRIYVVAFVAGMHHVLFTLDSIDGSVLDQKAVDPPGSSPSAQQERGALALGSGYVYVPLGGLYGDCGPYHGYVIGVPLAGGANAIYRTPTPRESGIWNSEGVTVADSGTVYATTGNGSETSSFAYSNSVLALSPDLKVQGFFAPRNWAALDAGDVDLGSVGVTMLPDSGRLIVVGKEGVAYLLDASHLGGIGGQVGSSRVCTGAWGGTASLGSLVFLPCIDALVALNVSATGYTVAWKAGSARMASPIVAGGAVWAIDVRTSNLYALNPSSGAELFHLPLGNSQHFNTPAATEGYVVAPAGSAVVAVRTA